MFQSKHNFQVLSCLSCVSSELWSSLSSEAGGGGSGLCSLTGRAELSSPSQAAENPARPSLRSLPLLPGPATRTHTAISRQILSSDGLLAQHGSLFWLTLITIWPKSLIAPVNDCLLSPGLSVQAGRGPGMVVTRAAYPLSLLAPVCLLGLASTAGLPGPGGGWQSRSGVGSN